MRFKTAKPDYSNGEQIRIHSFFDGPPPLDENLWRARALPELLWIGALQTQYGPVSGARIAAQCATCARQMAPQFETQLFATAGSYLWIEDFGSFKEELRRSNVLDVCANPLRTVFAHYPDFPLMPVLASPGDQVHAVTVETLQTFVESYADPSSRSSILLQAAVVWLAVDGGLLGANARGVLDHLETLTTFPATDLSRKIAKDIAVANQLLLSESAAFPDTPWPQDFWNRTRELVEKLRSPTS